VTSPWWSPWYSLCPPGSSGKS